MSNAETALIVAAVARLTCIALSGPPRWRAPALRAAWRLLADVAVD